MISVFMGLGLLLVSILVTGTLDNGLRSICQDACLRVVRSKQVNDSPACVFAYFGDSDDNAANALSDTVRATY